MKKFLIKIAYKILLKHSYDYLPYFYSGNVYEVKNSHHTYDHKNRKTILTITAEMEW